MQPEEKRDFDKASTRWDADSGRVKLANEIADAIIREAAPACDMDALDFGCGTGLVTLRLQPLVMLAKIKRQPNNNAETKILPNYAALWMSTRYMPEFETPTTYMYYWFIKTDTRNILVDVGTGPEFGKKLTNYIPADVMLGKLGLKPSDIDTIIVTHAHWDHVDGLDQFKNAKVYIQRACYRFTVEDGAEFDFFGRFGYPTRKDSLALFSLLWDKRLKLIDGNTELFPGIKVIKVDGHYPGLQLVVVDTKDKPVVLANDSMHFYANLEKDHPMGLYFGNLRDIVKAYETIRELNGIVVPGHDPKVLETFKRVQPEIAQVYP